MYLLLIKADVVGFGVKATEWSAKLAVKEMPAFTTFNPQTMSWTVFDLKLGTFVNTIKASIEVKEVPFLHLGNLRKLTGFGHWLFLFRLPLHGYGPSADPGDCTARRVHNGLGWSLHPFPG